ncbi:arylsulfatase J-like [Elysia marginata]|uniref:Arylsulfatase J-like n=1 Tax=Elysia marginata TaxID=1093978 RepID=A0AAV4IXL2_9GAST|nr:arylsulfatase J-like [Elysia marginata]
MLSALDDAVGDIYDTLQETDMLRNSIIVFTTDNGGPPNGFDLNAANNFPLRGGKETLWEGGVRGVGLIHSPLLQHQGYVSNNLVHVCDWLPTLLTAAGGGHLLDKPTSLDGVDVWEMLNTDGAAVRTELLHNIDPARPEAALRVGDYKLLVGNVNMKWAGWYPPYQLAGDDVTLHYLTITDETEAEEMAGHRKQIEKEYKSSWPTSVLERMRQLYTFAEESDLYTGQNARLVLEGEFQNTSSGIPGDTASKQEILHAKKIPVGGSPVKVKCGPRPSNASTNCRPTVSPCLYHVLSDPCEYNNIAAQQPHIVKKLLASLKQYESTMVPMLNKPFDPQGNPRLHDGAWVPWQ